MKQIYIFGTSCFSQILRYYEEELLNNFIAGYTLNKKYIIGDEKLDAPLVPFEELIDQKDNTSILIGIGYNEMNEIRKKVYRQVKDYGFEILSFIHPSAVVASNVKLGESSIILENAVVQPFVKIGNCNILWSNATIAHHANIEDYNFFASGSIIAGNVNVCSNCFFGANSTVRNGVHVASYSLIGAGSYISKDTVEEGVYSTIGTVPRESKSSIFHTV